MSANETGSGRRTGPHVRRDDHAVVGHVEMPHDQEHDLVLRVQEDDRAALDQLIDANLSSFDRRSARTVQCCCRDREGCALPRNLDRSGTIRRKGSS